MGSERWESGVLGETRVQNGKGGPTMSYVTKVQIGGIVKGVSWIQVFIINFLNLLIYLAVLGFGHGTRYLQSPLQHMGSSVVAWGI